jgi:hypothetical protein
MNQRLNRLRRMCKTALMRSRSHNMRHPSKAAQIPTSNTTEEFSESRPEVDVPEE